MRTDASLINRKILQQLEQISSLSPEAFSELATKTHIETQPARRRLFMRGHEDHWVYYLLAGEVQLDYFDAHSEKVHGGSRAARSPLANQQPRQATATTLSEVQFIRIDTNLLEVLSQEVNQDSYQLEEYTAEDENVRNRLFFALYSDCMAETLKLPQLPNVALKVKQIADDPEGDIQTLARVIQTSPVLPGHLIKIANSALYQLQTPVTSALAAVNILGMRKTRDLVITYTMRNLFRTDSSLIADHMQRLWRHCALTGAIAYTLSDMTPGLNPDRAMLLGLLHDIGVLPIIHYAGKFPELARNAPMLEESIRALRSQIGAMVLRQWEFADETVQVCLDAENWQRDPSNRPDYTDAVIIAQRLADALLDNQPPMEAVVDLPAFNKLARGRLNDEEILQELLTEAQQEIAAVFQLN
jgi:HD-like signal output (HDOD) protein